MIVRPCSAHTWELMHRFDFDFRRSVCNHMMCALVDKYSRFKASFLGSSERLLLYSNEVIVKVLGSDC